MTIVSLVSILDTSRADLIALRTRRKDTLTAPLVTDFLLSIYELGLAISSDTALRDSKELQQFLNETTSDLIEERNWLLAYPGSLVRKFQYTWEYDEWVQLCRLRSALQFFLDLYKDTPLAPFVQEIETDYLDDEIRDWGNREGFLSLPEIDPRIPHSHWWWWWPESPP